MPHSRQRPRVAPTGRITVRLTPAQRDLLRRSEHVSRSLGHGLHHAVVREGKLQVRVDRAELEALIAAAAATRVPDRHEERALGTLMRYLESLEDRFADPDDEPEDGDVQAESANSTDSSDEALR